MTPPRRRGRSLSEDEKALWEQIAATVTRRAPRKRAAPAEPPPEPPAPAPRPEKPPRRPTVLKPAGRPEPAVTLVNAPLPPRSGLDGKRAERLRRGQLPIEARIDLHGLTLDLAHAALGGFLVQARTRGHRCVLVITGKGGPGRESALKRLVPRWLAEPPFGAMIADRAPAQPRHGGEGALYVYLRRKR